MKKTYVKPGMYVENFNLSQSIATKCAAAHDSSLGTPSYADANSCGWQLGSDVIWAVEPCTDLMPEDVEIGGVCYNNPNGGTSIFSYS